MGNKHIGHCMISFTCCTFKTLQKKILKIHSKEESTHSCDLGTCSEHNCVPVKSIWKPPPLIRRSAGIQFVRK